MPGWDPFVGLTAVVLALFLGLARLSQTAIDEQSDSSIGEQSGGPTDEQPADSAIEKPADSTATETAGVAETSEPPEAFGSHRESEPAVDRSPEIDRRAPREMTTGALLANVALTQGVFGAIVAASAWYYEIPLSALGLGAIGLGTTAALGVGLAFGVALWGANEASTAVADAVGATYDEGLRDLLAPDTPGGWILLLGAILPIVATVEELLFRAALIGVPAAAYGISPWLLAVVSSAAFAFGHGAQGRVGVAVTGGLGLVLAAGYVVSGSLLVVIVAHYVVNAAEFVVHEGVGIDRFG